MDIKTLKANYPLTLPIHKLLGSCTHQSNTEWTFSSDISTINVEFLSDYKILENIMFPGAGYIEIVASLGRFFYQNNSVLIENLFIHTPLTLYASEEVRMDTVCTLKSDHLEVNIFTERSNQNVLSRVLNVSCKVSQKKNEVTYMDSKLINKIKSINNIKVNLEEFYNNLSILKISYGKNFKMLSNSYIGNDMAKADIKCSSDYFIYDPRKIYAVFQLFTLFLAKKSFDENCLYLPMGIEFIYCLEPVQDDSYVFILLEKNQFDKNLDNAQLFLFDNQHRINMLISNFKVRKFTYSELKELLHKFYQLQKTDNYTNPLLCIFNDTYQKYLHQNDVDLAIPYFSSLIFLWSTGVGNILLESSSAVKEKECV